MNLQHIARALGGTVTGGKVLAPGPGHSKFDRSLSVIIDPAGKIRVHSFAGDGWEMCRDYVHDRLGIRDADKRDYTPPQSHRQTTERPSTDDASRTARALQIWGEARPIGGTPAATYLVRRGVDLGQLPGDIHRVLRWNPACPWEDGKHGAIVALMTEAFTGNPMAIHRTALSRDGAKIGKKMLGPAGGCAIRLWPDESVTDHLVIGEGIETVLAAATRIEHRGGALAPAWACGSAGTMASFPVLSGIECLTLLVDNDASGTGQKAAAECSQRWTAAGREVSRLTPNETGHDFADITENAR